MAAVLNISLPEPLKAYVDAQAASGDYGTPGDYVRDLILNDRDRRRRNLEERLLDAVRDEAGSIEVPDEIWEKGDIVAYLESQPLTRG